MQGVPENREQVETLVDQGEKKRLFDSEYQRRKDEIGQRVEHRRKELGFSRPELSKKTGLAESTIAFTEQGRSAMNLETLILMCQGLECSSDYIIGLRSRNYDDVMRDSKTAHIVRKFLKFSQKHKDEVMWFIEAVAERVRQHGE